MKVTENKSDNQENKAANQKTEQKTYKDLVTKTEIVQFSKQHKSLNVKSVELEHENFFNHKSANVKMKLKNVK